MESLVESHAVLILAGQDSDEPAKTNWTPARLRGAVAARQQSHEGRKIKWDMPLAAAS